MVIWFAGGLGNQLFQYSLYKTVEDKGLDVWADLSWYDSEHGYGKDIESYKLRDLFNIELNVATDQQLLYYRSYLDIFDKVSNKVGLGNWSFNAKRIIEKKNQYIRDLITSANEKMYLKGYWQDYRYFIDSNRSIIDSIKFSAVEGENFKLGEQILNSNSVSIHVRRKTYLWRKAKKLYVNLSCGDYYHKAIGFIRERIPNIKVYIFTDDPEWCDANLSFVKSATIVTNNLFENSHIDMQLMSLCKHNVIANSTFSWWGAHLNTHPNKIVVAPSKWYTEKSKYIDSPYPKNWTVV